MRTYRVRARRSGDWWAIDSPDLPGAHSQAREAEDIELMARDAIALLLDVTPDSFGLDVHVES